MPKVPKVPKGPVTAYGSFVKEFYAENKEALKDPATGKATLGRITQAVSEAWKNLSESQKETYNAAAKEAKKAYDSTYKSFYESLSPETKKAIEKATGKKLSVPGGKLRAKQALREQPGYPGAPLTAFFEYLKDLREGGTVDTAGLEASEANLAVAKEAGNRWKAMSDSEKQVSCIHRALHGFADNIRSGKIRRRPTRSATRNGKQEGDDEASCRNRWTHGETGGRGQVEARAQACQGTMAYGISGQGIFGL